MVSDSKFEPDLQKFEIRRFFRSDEGRLPQRKPVFKICAAAKIRFLLRHVLFIFRISVEPADFLSSAAGNQCFRWMVRFNGCEVFRQNKVGQIVKKKSLLPVVLWLFFISLQVVAAADDHLSAIKSGGVLYFGTSPDYVPFVFYDDQGQICGLDVELIREAGSRMGVTVEVLDLAYDGLIDAARVGQVDLIGGALVKTEANASQVDFSRIYYQGTGRIVTLESADIGTLDSTEILNGKRIGVQQGTNFDQWIRTNLVGPGVIQTSHVVPYPVVADAMDGLKKGAVDFVLLDQYTYQRYFQSSGSYQIVSALPVREAFAFASRPGSSLIPEINRQLDAMILDGTAQRIAEAFFSRTYPIQNPRMLAPQVSDQLLSAETSSDSDPHSDGSCLNAMGFLGDITIPDGSRIHGGASFTKTWRVLNLGTCTWDEQYRFVRKNGPVIGGYPLTASVSPGGFYDFSVVMTAPEAAGFYKSSWQLQTPEGKNFGQTIWVHIEVPER